MTILSNKHSIYGSTAAREIGHTHRRLTYTITTPLARQELRSWWFAGAGKSIVLQALTCYDSTSEQFKRQHSFLD